MFERIKQSFRNQPVLNSLVVILSLSIIFLVYWSFFSGEKTLIQTKNKLVYMPGQEDDFFVPDQNKSEDVAASTDQLNFDLDQNLYQFIGNSVANVSAGVNNSSDQAKGNWITRALAQSNKGFPAVYYVNYLGDNTKILELNMFTGKTKDVVDEDRLIGFISFNPKKQLLAYSVNAIDTNTYMPHIVKIIDLKTKETKTIGNQTLGIDIRWSPDGNKLAFTDETDTNPQVPKYISIYDVQTQSINKLDLSVPTTTGLTTFSWTSDSNSLAIIIRERNGGTDREPVYYPFAYKLSVSDGTKVRITNKTGEINESPILVNNKLFSFVYNAIENNDYIGHNGEPAKKMLPSWFVQFGWLGVTDLAIDEYKEYRSETGDFLKQWLIGQNGETVVYTRGTGEENKGTFVLKLNYLDLNTGQVVDLPNLPGRYNLVGWTGNQENVTLWSASNQFYNVNIKTKVLTKITK